MTDMGYPEQYRDIELNPAPGGPVLDMDCRGGNHGPAGCVGPPGTRCDCSCHIRLPVTGCEPQPVGPQSCHFWDIRTRECRYEMLFLGCEPCASCPG